MFSLTRKLLVVAVLLGQVCDRLASGIQFNVTDTPGQGFNVSLGTLQLFQHTFSSPILFVGTGLTSFDEDSGNFFIDDYISARLPLSNYTINCGQISCTIRLNRGDTFVSLRLQSEGSQPLVIDFEDQSSDFDRIWLRLTAEDDEEVYGGGEQFSYFNLRHRDQSKENVFPVWVQEQGVGRNTSTEVTFLADTQSRAGGDYHTTYFPQPTFVSSRRYFFHHDGLNYAILDFRSSEFHEVFVLGTPGKFYINSRDTLLGAVTEMTSFFGRMPALPDWILSGAILGLQGGTETMLARYKFAKDNQIPVAALWIQDWSGKIEVPFGKRVNWDWKWDATWYPGLDTAIQNLTRDGVHVLAYINPYLRQNGQLFSEAANKGYLVKNESGGVYLQKSVSLVFASVDLTNPDAYNWYKNVIKTNMIDLGLGGWMADFGEYLPVDAHLYDGRSGLQAHNEWPILWARLNREAVEEAGRLGDIVFFVRAGFSGVSNYTTLMWGGDQNVDFSLADGVRSTIYGALSMGMSGVGLTHFDIGGYTTFALLGMVRTKELLLRSAELAVFTPVFRTHEGNQPEANVQWYSHEATPSFARLARQFALLKNYRKFVVNQVAHEGIPAMRSMKLIDEDIQEQNSQYLFGPDLLVAPVYKELVNDWSVVLPGGSQAYDWIHLWSDTPYSGGQTVTVASPLGQPPVFYRSDSTYRQDFEKLRTEGQISDLADIIIG